MKLHFNIMPVLFTLALTLASMIGLAQTAYITNYGNDTVSVINVATNTVTAKIPVGSHPYGVSVSADGTKVYIALMNASSVSVINTATNAVLATIPVGFYPYCVSMNPGGTKVYVTNEGDNTVSVINTATNTVTDTISVGNGPEGISVSPDGRKVLVANYYGNTVSVIDTMTNTVSATITVGQNPVAFGNFISTATFTGLASLNGESPSISIYPNPFTSQTTVAFSELQENTIIKISDMLGKEIKTINFTGKQLTIERGEMINGIYFVQITDAEKNSVNKKIIIE